MNEPLKVIFSPGFYEELDKLDLDEEQKILLLHEIEEKFVGMSIEELKAQSTFIPNNPE